VGQRLFDHARRIINTASIAKADMAALITGAGGEIRIGVAPQLATPGLMRLLLSLPRAMPMLSVTISEMFYDSLIHLLRLGELDLAIAYILEAHEQPDLNVEVLAETPVRLSIVMRKDHPLASLQTIPPQRLQQANWVAASQHHYLQTLAKYFTDRHMTPPHYRLYANTMSVLLRAILQEDFLALLPEETVAREFPPNSVHIVPNSSQMTKRRIGLIYTPNAIRSAAFLRLSNSVTEHYRDMAPAARPKTSGDSSRQT
jgi:DNA-binding transcriptional LysR family regulator